MQRYLAIRVVGGLITLLIASIVIFLAGRLSGDPLALLVPIDASQAQIESVTKDLGLDRPIPVQYGLFIANMLRGDFGNSFRTKRPVTEILAQRWPNSMRLALPSLFLALLIAFPLGVLAALKRGTLVDTLTRGLALFGQSVPSFVLGIVLVAVVAGVWGWLPAGGRGGPNHYVLPVVTLTFTGFLLSGVIRFLRSGMLEVLDSEYVKLARSKGLSERVVIWKHALKNAALPVLTFLGFYLAAMIGGATIIVETVFAWPGVGYLLFQSIGWRDFPVVQATVMLVTFGFIVVNLMVDIAYAYLNPRIRF